MDGQKSPGRKILLAMPTQKDDRHMLQHDSHFKPSQLPHEWNNDATIGLPLDDTKCLR